MAKNERIKSNTEKGNNIINEIKNFVVMNLNLKKILTYFL